jgi:hypothetical protein
MRKTILPLFLLFILQYAAAQTNMRKNLPQSPYIPKISTVSYKLGERIIQIKVSQYGDLKDIVYVNLHDDEITAVNAARRLLERDAGILIKIENYKTRNIKFKLEGKYYTFDPNRMFSRIGIIQTLTMFGKISPKAIDEVEKFANLILKLIPQKTACIIALHNNSNGKFSINSYLPGNIREKDAKNINVNPDEDPDDIFLTTDSILYRQLSEDKYNTILQDNEKAKKDGSLSIYCGERNIRYVNCETEHGHDNQYQQMIMLVAGHVEKIDTEEVIAYNYRLAPAAVSFSPKSNTDILFGEKKVGLIRSVATDSSWATVGKLEVTSDFPLYSNMDLLFIPSPANTPRFEVRIDPTRQKELLDPSKTIVSIRAGH